MEIISVDGSNLIFKGFQHENLYLIDFNSIEAQLSTFLLSKTRLSWLWNRRLTHVYMKQLDRIIKHALVKGLKDINFGKDRLYV